jgi:hypothetical protein
VVITFCARASIPETRTKKSAATTPTNQFFKLVANTDLFISDRLMSDEEE